MADPKNYLPNYVPTTSIHALLRSISLPIPTTTTLLSTSAAYHTVYTLSYPTPSESPTLYPNNSSNDLILRIAGHHFLSIKTSNECAMLNWLSRHTSIPVPKLLHYDVTSNNELGYEYMLISMATGRSFDVVRKELKEQSLSKYEDHLEGLLVQIVDVISELNSHYWNHIGGLKEIKSGTENGKDQKDVESEHSIVPGPIVDETMFQVPELDLFWESKETFENLNVTGPFSSYVEFMTAQAEKCLYCIQHHVSLSPFLDLIPFITAFMAAMDKHKEELNRSRLVLAHRDLHFGNIMYDTSTKRITAILDWEFAAIVPAPRWDPQRAFLWNCVDNEEKTELKERVMKKCKDRGVTFFRDVDYTGPRQEHMQSALRFLGAIVQVMPRSQGNERANEWRHEAIKHMNAVCIN